MELLETQRLVDRWVVIDEALFEALGAAVPAIVEPEVKVAVAEVAHHHAWHAELWRRRRPDVGPSRPDAAEGRSLVASVREAVDSGQRLDAYLVLARRLGDEYDRFLLEASDASDGPLVRAVRLAGADLADDAERLAALLQGLGGR